MSKRQTNSLDETEGRCPYLQHHYDFAVFRPANCGARCTEERSIFRLLGVVCEATVLWAKQCGEQGRNIVAIYLFDLFSDGLMGPRD